MKKNFYVLLVLLFPTFVFADKDFDFRSSFLSSSGYYYSEPLSLSEFILALIIYIIVFCLLLAVLMFINKKLLMSSFVTDVPVLSPVASLISLLSIIPPGLLSLMFFSRVNYSYELIASYFLLILVLFLYFFLLCIIVGFFSKKKAALLAGIALTILAIIMAVLFETIPALVLLVCAVIACLAQKLYHKQRVAILSLKKIK